jgi:hypothetical protein
MKMIQGYLLAFVMLAFIPVLEAATWNGVLPAGNTNVSQRGWNIFRVTVGATSTNAVTVSLYDTATTNITYVVPAYTNRVTVATNLVQVVTNSVGIVQTNIYPGVFTSLSAVAAVTNTLPALVTIYVPPNGSVERDVRVYTVNGLTINSSTNALMGVVDYVNRP